MIEFTKKELEYLSIEIVSALFAGEIKEHNSQTAKNCLKKLNEELKTLN